MYNDLLLNRIGAAPVEDPDEHIQELIEEIEELKSLTSPEAQELIRDLRPRLVTDDVYEDIDPTWLPGGESLFRRGDPASELFFTLSGRFRLEEIGIDLGPGQVVGELGLLAPENRRSQTLACSADGEVLTITYDQVRQLYFQNPEFGFYFLRLTTERLFENVGRLETEVAALRTEAAESAASALAAPLAAQMAAPSRA